MNLYNIREKLNLGFNIYDLPLRVTFYSRVSTDSSEQVNSLNNQIDYFHNMIRSNSKWVYVEGYIDEGITGISDVKRESFMKMIEDAKKGLFDLIVTKEISRFSRNTLDSIKYTRELLNYGVAVLFLNDNINTALADSEFRLTIMASLAQDEIRKLSSRVKFGMKQSIKKYNILGNNMLYGYKKNKETGSLTIIPDEANVVKNIFNMYVFEDKSLSSICKFLNDNNIKTVQNKKWCVSTLSRMIRNIKYKGYYCGNKSEVVDYMSKKVKQLPESEWIIKRDFKLIPPIISEQVWNLANDKIVSKKKANNELKRYLFSGKIICSSDFYVFHRRHQLRNGEISWICSNQIQNGKRCCNGANIRESELFYILNDIISKINISSEYISNSILKLYNKYNDKTDIKKYKNELDIINQKKEKLYELNFNGFLTNSEFKIQNEKYNDMIEILNNNIARAKCNNCCYEKDILCCYKDIVGSELFINLLLDKIVAKKIDENNIYLEIYLKFLRNEIKDEYYFKRGYDKIGTKRYTVRYVINCKMCH